MNNLRRIEGRWVKHLDEVQRLGSSSRCDRVECGCGVWLDESASKPTHRVG
jgi:hypothetical protein